MTIVDQTCRRGFLKGLLLGAGAAAGAVAMGMGRLLTDPVGASQPWEPIARRITFAGVAPMCCALEIDGVWHHVAVWRMHEIELCGELVLDEDRDVRTCRTCGSTFTGEELYVGNMWASLKDSTETMQRHIAKHQAAHDAFLARSPAEIAAADAEMAEHADLQRWFRKVHLDAQQAAPTWFERFGRAPR